jgi:trimethylamine--corrinoid protein Co-methyltransferase
MLVDVLAGGHMVHDLGYLESAYCGSLSQLVLCDEIAGWIRHVNAPVDLSDEALALDVIDEVGPGGLFLAHRHTRVHARDRFPGRLFDRSDRRTWLARGGQDATTRAAARVDEILGRESPYPLDASTRAQLRAIVERAEARLRGGPRPS